MLYGASDMGNALSPLFGPNDAFSDTMYQHTMAWGTLGYRFHPTGYPSLVNTPAMLVNQDPGDVTGLGCCDWCTNDSLGGLGELGFGSCPSGPTVVVESSPIPDWAWLIAAGWALLMLVKKGG
jgi:hypothetical protein